MTPAEVALSALNGWKLNKPQRQQHKPERLEGGCLLYRLPRRPKR